MVPYGFNMENHGTKWWVFHLAMFDYERVALFNNQMVANTKTWHFRLLPSGKHTKNDGKSYFLMGKSTN